MDSSEKAIRHRTPLGAWLSVGVILLMTLVGLFAPVLSPDDPRRIAIGQSNFPPAWYNTPTQVGHADHLLGTDRLGRDILSHVIYGARAAMLLTVMAIPLAASIGTLVGVLAGIGNKTAKRLFLGTTDILSAVPSFMFAVIIIYIVRVTPVGEVLGGLITLTLAFGLINWVSLARLIYPSILKVEQMEFMEAARSLGAGPVHQVFVHILPHISHLIIVWIVNNIPALILLEALMGYIGIPILQGTERSNFQDVSWGGLILMGRTRLNFNPFILLVPTICILIISMSFSILGEYLSERTNPQLESNQIV